MDNTFQKYTEILDTHAKLKELRYEHWLNYELFTLPWWAIMLLLFVSWGVGWYLIDKKRITQMLTYGFLVFVVSTAMDAFGISRHLWIYPIKPLWFVPHMIPLDWGFLPVSYVLVYQYFPNWEPFLLATLIMSAFLAFIGEPFSQWIGIYFVYRWEYTWSFFIYIAIAVVNKLIVDRLVLLQKKC